MAEKREFDGYDIIFLFCILVQYLSNLNMDNVYQNFKVISRIFPYNDYLKICRRSIFSYKKF